MKQLRMAYGLLSPSLIWLLLFLLFPLGLIAVISFTTNLGFGGILYEFSTEAYRLAFSSLYAEVIWKSLLWAGIGTFIALLIAYPFAYFIAHAGKWKNILLVLVMIPSWVNFLILMYAWIILLNSQGVVNNMLVNLGFIAEPLTMLYTPYAVIIGVVYGFLPFMILPIYASVEQLDHSLLEAAEDLGAKPYKAFFKVTLPLTAPGIFAGILLTFIPALSVFTITDILTGGKLLMIGNIIRDAFIVEMNWQLGAAISILLTILVLLSIFLFTKFTSKEDQNLLF